MKKIVLYGLSCVIVFIVVFTIHQSFSYKIRNDLKEIETAIEVWSSRGEEVITDYTHKKSKDVDDTKLVYLFVGDTDYQADAILTKGWNGKYKIESTGQGSNLFRYKTMKTDKGSYVWIMGKNYDLKIDRIKTFFKNETCEMRIPKEEFFIEVCRLKKTDVGVYAYPYKIKVLNDQGSDILQDLYVNYH
ncbi:hypothetical protein [Paenibacillus lutrae]|uniref:Uncharacterized protein n=1 Tax=Paenibacillus lutrae TaxID=2078573 RepID=A0A7X3FGV0_9BACL|nr:hypothetical protein [Paenibacillus lutrae]MVO99518.1 hypothetical protein [Paenibacillus lutrae]